MEACKPVLKHLFNTTVASGKLLMTGG